MITGTTEIKAIAIRDNYFDSPIASFTVTRGVWTLGEYLNCPEQEFMTGGDAEWIREKGASEDGYALKSGNITHSQTSRVETVVMGPGMISFSCRVEGEILKGNVYDGLAFFIDGVQQGDLMGNKSWTTYSYDVAGEGAHTLTWMMEMLLMLVRIAHGLMRLCGWVEKSLILHTRILKVRHIQIPIRIVKVRLSRSQVHRKSLIIRLSVGRRHKLLPT